MMGVTFMSSNDDNAIIVVWCVVHMILSCGIVLSYSIVT